MRRIATTIAVGAALLMLPAQAAAHVALMPGEVEPSGEVAAQLVVVHGCGPNGTIPTSDDDALATLAVSVRIPQGVTITPEPTSGWTAEQAQDGLRWVADDGRGTTDPITFDVRLAADGLAAGSEVWVPVVQECAEGEQLAWVGTATESADSPLPGARLLVANPPPREGPSTVVLVTLVVAAALAAGAAAVAITGRKG